MLKLAFVVVLLLFAWKNTSCARLKITNLKCTSSDESLFRFRYCYLKVVKRGVIGVYLYMENYSRNFYNLTYNYEFLKKANSYHPFLYNVSGKVCDVYKTAVSSPLLKLIFDGIPLAKQYVHKCPYNEDIVLNNLQINEDIFDRLPVPSGDYLVLWKLALKNVWKIKVMGYATLNDTKFV